MTRPGPSGENQVSARVGSTGELDKVAEDFTSTGEAQATGYHGKNSELVWMQRLKTRALHDTDEDGEEIDCSRSLQEHASTATPISQLTYHCDDLDVSLPEQVDLLSLPPRTVADSLLNNYLEFIHPLFPIISKSTFSSQYHGFFDEGRSPTASWRAILNLIFAIAAKHAHLIKAPWRGIEEDHLVYFARARGLGLNSDDLLVHANMQRVQLTGLMAFYLLAINQVNR